MQVVQHWSALLDATEWDPAHYLAPYVGDVVAERVSCWVKKGIVGINGLLKQQKNSLKMYWWKNGEDLLIHWKC